MGQIHEKKCFFDCVPNVIMKIGLPFQIMDIAKKLCRLLFILFVIIICFNAFCSMMLAVKISVNECIILAQALLSSTPVQ